MVDDARAPAGRTGAAPAGAAPAAQPRRRRLVCRLLAVVAALASLALVAAVAVVVVAVRAPLPQRDGTLELPGLSAPVEVLRDARGVPHVYADTAEDLFRAQGFVHAQDRFFEMDLRRRITAGRLAELVGDDPAALEADAVVRTLGWRRTAEAEVEMLPAPERAWLVAYSDGVDAWVDGRSPRRLSLAYTVLGLQVPLAEVEPWQPADSVAWLKAMAWDLRSNYSAELGRAQLLADGLPAERVDQLYPGYPAQNPTIVRAGEPVPGAEVTDLPQPTTRGAPQRAATSAAGPAWDPATDAGVPAALADAGEALTALDGVLAGAGLGAPVEDGIGSNSWVVAGEHTASGAPLLANDPHLAPASPSTWHQVGLHCRVVSEACPYDVVGYSFSGLPGVLIGQTPDVAWGLTTLYADHTDLVLERLDGDAQERDGRLVPLTVREEVIEVAGGEPVTVRVREGVNGPLLSDALTALGDLAGAADAGEPVGGAEGSVGREHAVALRWTATRPGTTMQSLLAMGRATSAEDVVAAAALLDVPGQSIVLAETGVGGRIGYVVPSEVPRRTAGDGTVPVPGWDSAYDWREPVPRGELPVVLEPTRGWLATANNKVLAPGSEEEAALDLGVDTDHGYRAAHIETALAALTARGDVTVEDMVALQLDTTSPLAAHVAPAVVAAARDRADGLEEPLALLEGWDGSQPVDSAAAAYAAAVWRHLLAGTFHDELAEPRHPDGGSRWVTVMEALLEAPEDPWWDDVTTAGRETRDDVLARAAVDAHAELRERLGEDPTGWRWGDLHTLEPAHTPLGGQAVPAPVRSLFNLPSRGLPGGSSTVLAASWSAVEGYEVTAVPSMRMVVDLADRDASRWVDLTGVSGHPTDAHHGDQWQTWADGGTFPMPVTREAVVDAARVRQELVPSRG